LWDGLHFEDRDSLDGIDLIGERDPYMTLAPLDTRFKHHSLATNFSGPFALKPFRESVLTRSFH
jgi:hypothetical protein